jgi:hypothetical protein
MLRILLNEGLLGGGCHLDGLSRVFNQDIERPKTRYKEEKINPGQSFEKGVKARALSEYSSAECHFAAG